MLLEAWVGAPAPLRLVDAGVVIVPIEQVLAARVGGSAERFKERRELGIGDRATVDPELVTARRSIQNGLSVTEWAGRSSARP
jgi:hypothetical protein